MRAWMPAGLLLALCHASAGCSYLRIAPQDINPSTQEERRTVHLVAWRLYPRLLSPSNCNGNGLAEVVVESNIVYSAIALLTFGFWTPIDVHWKCAKDQPSVEAMP